MHYISIPWKSHQYYQKSCFQQFCMLSETEERKKGVFYVYLDLYHFSFILPLSWSLKCSSGIISLQPEEFPLVLILDQFSWLQILLVCFHLNFFFFFFFYFIWIPIGFFHWQCVREKTPLLLCFSSTFNTLLYS